jgi:hypothetical protein
LDEQHERRLLVGERLHRQANAEEPLRVVNADTSFRAATRTPLGLNERPPSRGRLASRTSAFALRAFLKRAIGLATEHCSAGVCAGYSYATLALVRPG